MTIKSLLNQIPYVVWHDISVEEEGPTVFTMGLSDRREVQNYVGTLHAGVLYTLAETVAGVAAHSIVAKDGGFILLRDATVNYTRLAKGDVIARVDLDRDAAVATLADYKDAGRADTKIVVVISDQDGEAVFQGSFNYAVRTMKK